MPAGLAAGIRRAVREELARPHLVRHASTQEAPGGISRRQRRSAAPAWAAAAVLVLALGGTLLWRSAPPGEAPEGPGARLDLGATTPSVWPAGDGMVAGAPLLDDLSDLSDEDLLSLLAELEG